MGYQVLQSVICKYNFHPHRNSGLRFNINKINTQLKWNNQIGKPGINDLS